MYICTAEQVDEGEARVKVIFGTRVISDKTFDLCNVQAFWNISCPLYPGNLKVITLLLLCTDFIYPLSNFVIVETLHYYV